MHGHNGCWKWTPFDLPKFCLNTDGWIGDEEMEAFVCYLNQKQHVLKNLCLSTHHVYGWRPHNGAKKKSEYIVSKIVQLIDELVTGGRRKESILI